MSALIVIIVTPPLARECPGNPTGFGAKRKRFLATLAGRGGIE